MIVATRLSVFDVVLTRHNARSVIPCAARRPALAHSRTARATSVLIAFRSASRCRSRGTVTSVPPPALATFEGCRPLRTLIRSCLR